MIAKYTKVGVRVRPNAYREDVIYRSLEDDAPFSKHRKSKERLPVIVRR